MGKLSIDQLTEVKKGHTGTGLLIERDGHIDSDTDLIKQIHEDINNNHKFVIPEHFVVSAVFQKYGIKNANGRIYPESILKREVDKYQDKIRSRCALGSLDHPSCMVFEDSNILTEKGWKKIQDIEEGENILTITPDKRIEVHPIIRKINEPYKGKMYHFKGRFIDITVTPNHRFPIWDRHKNWKGFYTAEDIYNNRVPDQSHSYFFKTGEWHNNSDEEFVIKGLSEEEVSKISSKALKEKYVQDVHVPMDVWMKFMGIYLSEGDSCYIRENGKKDARVRISQKKQEVIDEIEEMLKSFPLEYIKHIHKNGSVTFVIQDLRLSKYLSQFGKCYDKYVPYEIKKQGKDMLRIFYDWFVMGDGRKRGLGPGKYYSDDVFSSSKQLVMDLNEIQLKIGYCGSYHEEDRHIDRLIEGRLIKAENSHNMHFTMRSHCECIVLAPKSLTITEEEYDGRVYCVEVENHTFYTMCKNGKCLWSGNSSSISGHDISHNILSLEWKGHTLIGEMELQLSPGYIRYGVCSTSGDLVANMLLSGYLIGVSSRGVGSVEQKFGEYVVCDDFEIVCWDCVCEPSTPGAFIKTTRDELSQYVENDETRKNKPIVSENKKLVDIEKILTL